MDEEDGFGMADGDAHCIAERIAGEFGAERVEEIDWEAETPEFTEDEASYAVESFKACVDLSELFATSIASEGVSQESLDCVADETNDDDVEALFDQSFRQDGEITEELVAPIDEVLQSCLSAEEYESIS